MNIGVIGAGIFGVTVSLILDAKGHNVCLYEKNDDILMEASLGNQFRLHRGYHYPRSYETASELISAAPEFEMFYTASVKKHNNHFYCIAKEKSFITSSEYIKFCDSLNLEYSVTRKCPVDYRKIDLSILVNESLISYSEMKKECITKLDKSSVNVLLKSEFEKKDIERYDAVINCSYSNLNKFSNKKKEYQFELCEKICIQLPAELRNVSIVIMDGPFMCIDPFRDGNHLMGNVVHAIHETNVGIFPSIPERYRKHMGRGFEDVGSLSRFKEFIYSGQEYIPGLAQAEYISSKFVVRSVLPNVEDTDERPTLITEGSKVIDVFSGKIDTCVSVANRIVKILDNKKEKVSRI